MATIPQIRTRLLEGFPEKQADLLAHVVIEAHDDLVNQADFHALTGVVKELADSQKELADAQKELAESQRELTEAQRRTEATVADLAEAQKLTEAAVTQLAQTQDRMLIRLDRLDGRSLEITLARHLPAYVGRVFRKCRILDPLELADGLEDRLSEAELDDLLRTDILATARLDGQQVHLVVEVSCTADGDDIARVVRRAASLARVGLPAIGIVACEAISPQTLTAAQRQGVRVLADGRLMPDAA